MKKSALQVELENAGLETRSYSGRGMFGRSCLGTEADLGEFLVVLVYGTNDENQDELAETVQNIRTDSMGLGGIFYFPGTKYVSDEEDEDEEDADDEEDSEMESAPAGDVG